MSVDEFDPDIERLFARTPTLPDAALFTAEVEARLQRGGRVRSLVLALAGLIGAAVAVRETASLGGGLAEVGGDGVVAGDALGAGLHAVALNGQIALQRGLEQVGLGQVASGGAGAEVLGGMQMFWVVAGVIVALSAAGIMRVSQDI